MYFNTQTKRGSPYFIAILQLHRQQFARSTRVYLEISTGVATVAEPFRHLKMKTKEKQIHTQ